MPDNDQTIPLRLVLNPVYWPTWLGLGLLWLSTRLPVNTSLSLGRMLGYLLMLFSAERRRVARANIRACFPELDRSAQRKLLRDNFAASGMALFESALAWWGTQATLKPLLHIEGLEYLEQAMQAGNGAILLGGHYTSVEMGGRIMSTYFDRLTPTYKKARNPAFEFVMARARGKMHQNLLRSTKMRDLVRTLKNGQAIWYAPDQDFGARISVYAPFFGIQAATLTMTSRLAKITGAPVLPWYVERLPAGQGFVVRIGEALKNFPSGDDVQDATAVNAVIEAQARRVPEQYLWGHRRFKSRPKGEPQLYAHRRDRPLRRYAQVLALLSIPLLAYTLWLAFRNRDISYLKQRYGYFPRPMQQADLWFHAASVGEVIAVLPLLAALREKHPDKRIVLTTFTPTGAALARKKLPAGVAHYYLPLDYEYAVTRLLDGLRPHCCIIMETEIWPHLHQHCFNRGIPVIIINGRLSGKTIRARGWVRHLLGRSIEFAWFILARSETDRRRFLELYNAEEKIRVLGNLKFAITDATPPDAIDLGKPYILAASTHDDEEIRLARMWQGLDVHSHYLVIAPRHPHRSAKIVRQLQAAGITPALRSKQQAPDTASGIYLADTFGELGQFIAGAEFVFMGGSLVEAGGHNILEVGAQGKAVIFGPHMENFRDEHDLFLENKAAFEIADEARLAELLRELLAQPELARETGRRAQEVLQKRRHILADYVSALEEICPALAGSKSDAQSTG